MARSTDALLGFGDRLKRARLRRGSERGDDLSQSEVARAIGVSPSTVQRWENGGTPPDLMTIARLADFLLEEPAYLAFGARTLHAETGHYSVTGSDAGLRKDAAQPPKLGAKTDTVEEFEARATPKKKRSGGAT